MFSFLFFVNSHQEISACTLGENLPLDVQAEIAETEKEQSENSKNEVSETE